MSVLERRYRRLLRAYPKPYRAERGEEILGTLLEAAPAGRAHPAARESASVIIGGLRVRSAANRQLPLAASLRLTALLATAIWAIGIAAGSVIDLSTNSHWPTADHKFLIFLAGYSLAACAAIAAAWFARRGAATAIALVIAVAAVLQPIVQHEPLHEVGWFLPMLAVTMLALAALSAGKAKPPRCWLWLVGGVFLLELAGSPLGWALGPPLLWAAGYLTPWLLLLTVLAWAIADTRPLVAVALYAAFTFSQSFGLSLPYGWSGVTALTPFAISLAVAAAASIRLRRKAAPQHYGR